jgi:hypothetical protein
MEQDSLEKKIDDCKKMIDHLRERIEGLEWFGYRRMKEIRFLEDVLIIRSSLVAYYVCNYVLNGLYVEVLGEGIYGQKENIDE